MAAAFQIRTEGTQRVERKMAGLADRFGDLTPLMEQFGLYLEDATIDRFDREVAPDGTPWKPSLRARTEGGKTLTYSGRLKASITSSANPDSVETGSNVIYAGAHQGGATIRPINGEFLAFRLPGGLGFRRVKEVELPARPFLGLSIDDEAELLALAEDYADLEGAS